MHALLTRQLKRLKLAGLPNPDPAAWQALLERVSRSYEEADQDRYTLERSLSISSREMQQLYEDLRRSAETELAREHEKLLESLAVLNAIHEAAPDGILVVGADRRVITFNRRFARMWDLSESALAEGDAVKLLAQAMPRMANPEETAARIRYLYEHPGESSREELRLVDGRVIDRHSAPVLAQHGQRCGRVWYFREITAQRQAEEALRLLNVQLEGRVAERTQALAKANAELDDNLCKLGEAQEQLFHAGKMAAIGTLAAGVAHDINNPLASLMNNVSFIRERMDVLAAAGGLPPRDADELGDALRDVARGAERVRVIVRDLLTMSRREPEQRSAVDINRALELAVSFAANELRRGARVVWDLGEIPAVFADEARLGQVFLNLIVNAAHAVPEHDPERNRIRIASRAEGKQVVVEVQDRGSGIPEAHLARIFDPFFTTKPIGKGTGLGLSICQSIVRGLGGRIVVESQPGEGSLFRVSLPAQQVRPGAPLPGPAAAPVAVSRGRVLVLDDEEQVGHSLRRLLGAEHEVTYARSASQALALLGPRCEFDIVLCDIMMPEMNGMEFYAELLAASPDLAARVVFMTGAASPESESFVIRTGRRSLEKPCDPVRLRSVVAELIQRRAGATPAPATQPAGERLTA